MTWQGLFTEPVREMWTKILSFLPNLLVAVVILLVGLLLARVVGTLIERLLRMARFDMLTERAGINQALQQGQIKTTPSGILGKLFYWIVVLLALVMSIDALGLTVASELLNRLLLYIPNVIAAVFILALGFFFGDLARGFVATLASGVLPDSAQTIGKVAQVVVVIFAVVTALGQLGIGDFVVGAINIILAGVVFALALAFGLGCQGLVKQWVESITRK